MTPPLTRRLRCPRRREGNGTTTQPQTLMNRIHGEHADLPQLFVSKIGVFFPAGHFRAAEAGFVGDAPQFLFGDPQQHRRAPRGHELQGLLQLVMFFVDRVASHHFPLYAESKTMESRSTVMIIDLYMSTSQPSPMRMRIVSLPSFSNVPRSGTLISPSATCKSTDCPTHALYTFSMPLPQCCPTTRESRSTQKSPMVHIGHWTSKKVLLAESFHFSDFSPAKYLRTVLAGPLAHMSGSAVLAFCKPWHRSNISTALQRLAPRPAGYPARRSIPPSCPIVQCQQAIFRAHRSKTHRPSFSLTGRSRINHRSTIALSARCSEAMRRPKMTLCLGTILRGPVWLLRLAEDLLVASLISECCKFLKKIKSPFRTLP